MHGNTGLLFCQMALFDWIIDNAGEIESDVIEKCRNSFVGLDIMDIVKK